MLSCRRIRVLASFALSWLVVACGGSSSFDGLFPLWVETDVLVADIDGDGRKDILTLAQFAAGFDQREGRLQVHLQTAPGVFAPAQTYIVGIYPWKMDLGDIDGDGAPDLVIADVGSTSSSTGRAVWMLRQDAAHRGHFESAQRLAINPSRPYDLAIGDVNGDHAPDIVVADSLSPGRGATVLYQDAAHRGTFLAPVLIPLLGDATHVAIGDLNADGRNDLVFRMFLSTSNYVPSSAMGVAYQQPGGTLGAAQILSPQIGLNGNSLTIADYSTDGVMDVVEYLTPFSEDYQAKVLTLLQSNPPVSPASFVPVDTSLAGVNGKDDGVVADLNGDGKPDFASVGFYPVGSPTTVYSTLNIFMQNGSGGFTLTFSMAMPISSSRVTAGDINGDGLNDLVVLGKDSQVLVSLQSATAVGTFLPPQRLN